MNKLYKVYETEIKDADEMLYLLDDSSAMSLKEVKIEEGESRYKKVYTTLIDDLHGEAMPAEYYFERLDKDKYEVNWVLETDERLYEEWFADIPF